MHQWTLCDSRFLPQIPHGSSVYLSGHLLCWMPPAGFCVTLFSLCWFLYSSDNGLWQIWSYMLTAGVPLCDDYTKSLCVCVYCLACTFYLVFIGSITTSRSMLCSSHIPKTINFLIGKLASSASIANVIVTAFNYTHIYF